MTTNPISSEEFSPDWPDRGGAMSEEEYHELQRLHPDHKYEYIAGIVYEMIGDTAGHHRIAHNISVALNPYLTGSCASFGADTQVFVNINKSGEKYYLYPDATISCNPSDTRPDNALIESPRIVFEVLSPCTEARERGVKFNAYQQCPTIQEIVLINQFVQSVEVWQRDEHHPELWQHRHYGPGETIELVSIQAHARVEQLYQGLDFELDDDEYE